MEILLSAIIILFGIAVVLDFKSTHAALASSPRVFEKNPITRACITKWGRHVGLIVGAIVIDLMIMWAVLIPVLLGVLPLLWAVIVLGVGAVGQFWAAIHNYKLAKKYNG